MSDLEQSRRRQWWARVWDERQDAIEAVYGPSEPAGYPAGYVRSFDWDDIEIPSGCCLTCPPVAVGSSAAEPRPHWLYATLGLTQPDSPEHAKELAALPGRHVYAHEYGLLLAEPAEWAPRLLRQLMWFVRTHAPVNAGDRVPFGAEVDEDGKIDANLGDQAADGVPVAGSMRALVVWPNLANTTAFSTSADEFDLLICTAITGPEWDLARRLSSEHLLLLLMRCGVGQRTDLFRDDTTLSPRWGEDHRLVSSMSRHQAGATLAEYDVNDVEAADD